MFFVLRSKRQPKLIPFHELPFLKRLLYRLIHLTSLGNISILITFIQILSEITRQDIFGAVEALMGALNGRLEGYASTR